MRSLGPLFLLTACGYEGPSDLERCMSRGGAYGVSGQHTEFRPQLVGKIVMQMPYTVTDYGCFTKGRPLTPEPRP